MSDEASESTANGCIRTRALMHRRRFWPVVAWWSLRALNGITAGLVILPVDSALREGFML